MSFTNKTSKRLQHLLSQQRVVGADGHENDRGMRNFKKTTKKNRSKSTSLHKRENNFSKTENGNILLVGISSKEEDEDNDSFGSEYEEEQVHEQLDQSGSTASSKNLAHMCVCDDMNKNDDEEDYDSDLSPPHHEGIENDFEDLPEMSICPTEDISVDKKDASDNETEEPKPIDIPEAVLKKMIVSELKEELKKRGMDVSGKKKTYKCGSEKP